MFTAGVLNSFNSATGFTVLTNTPLVNFIFRRNHNLQSFTIHGFTFIFEMVEEDLDICYYTIRWGDFTMLFPFFAISTSRLCGPLSNLNFVWVNSERLSFVKYPILLFPPKRSRPPVLLFLRYHRARSDGWTDIDGCLTCVEDYQVNLHCHNNSNRPGNCYCDTCRQQPPSLLDSASHILFRCVGYRTFCIEQLHYVRAVQVCCSVRTCR
jgi:hypothetical protein